MDSNEAAALILMFITEWSDFYALQQGTYPAVYKWN